MTTSNDTRVRPVLLAGFALLYVVAIGIGRSLIQPETGLSLFWPASGVGIVWFGVCVSRREQLVTVALIYLISTLGNATSGVPWLGALVLGVANVMLGITPWVVTMGLRSWQQDRRLAWPARPFAPIASMTWMARIVLGILVGAAVSIPVGLIGVSMAGGESSATAALAWFDRHLAAGLVIALPVLAFPRRHEAPVAWTGLVTLMRHRRAEAVVLFAISAAVISWVFGPEQSLPLAFIPLTLLVWSGTRMPVFVATVHASFIAILTMVLVMMFDGGPFGQIPDPGAEARVAQAFASVTVVIALVLVLSVRERDWISQELRGAEKLQRSRASDLTTVMDTVPIGIIVVNRSGEVERANAGAYQVLGAHAGGVLAAHRLVELRRPDGSPVPITERPAALALRGHVVTDMRLRVPTLEHGEDRVLSFDAAPLVRDPDTGEEVHSTAVDRAIVVFRDVTEEHQHLQQLESFAGIVAHDLREPLSTISGWTDMLEEALGRLGVADNNHVGRSMLRIRSSIGRGTSLISDLLDYSVTRTAPLHPIKVDLDDLVKQLSEGMVAAAPERGIQIEADALGVVVADPVMVRQIFANLLGNAVKYTSPEVQPHVRLLARRDATRLELTLVDNGVGIPIERRSDIFQPFQRAHDDDLRFSGTGLGLAICERAVARHGGSITVDDNGEEPGSRFVFTLPTVEHEEELADSA